MDYHIETTTWTLGKLLKESPNIIKPKFQRDKKWTIKPTNQKLPNYKDYIIFLKGTRNSVFPISLGTEIKQDNVIYLVIDGNNRINAIITFLLKPYLIFPEYFEKIISMVMESEITNKEILINWIQSLTYNKLSTFKRIHMIDGFPKEIIKSCDLQLALDDELTEIQNKFLINSDSYDKIIHLNINIFRNGSYNDYCKIFQDINKHSNILSENELLSAILFNTEIILSDKELEHQIRNKIKTFYENRGQQEVLTTYTMNNEDKLNIFDFMVGFQNYCHEKYNVIPEFDSNGLSLLFRIFKLLYGDIDSKNFTTENIHSFIKNIIFSSDVLNKSYQLIFSKNINVNIFGKSSKLNHNLKKNQLILLLISIIVNKDKISEKHLIQKNRAVIIYHLLCNLRYLKNLSEEELSLIRNEDTIGYSAGGSFINSMVKKLMTNEPSKILDINKDKFMELINTCVKSSIHPKQFCDKNKKRRQLNLLDRILITNYYHRNMPQKFINQNYSIEHITPFSSSWNGEIDIDRLGNLFPTLNEINIHRGNKDLTIYKDKYLEFYNTIINILPEKYNEINHYENRKTSIISTEKYDEYCLRNEKLFIDNLINELYD
jgi:hypothetical protein